MTQRKLTPHEVAVRGGRATAATHHGEEYLIGHCPNRETYSSDMPTPTWDELLNLLAKEKIDKCLILFCGKVYSTGQKGGGTGFGFTDRASIQNVALEEWDPGLGGITSITKDPNMTIQLAMDLMKFNERPIHITGIVVREIKAPTPPPTIKALTKGQKKELAKRFRKLR